jgi:hypothetical protein
MAYAKITFEHPEIGTVRKAPVGFSWTLLFFGPIVCLFRRDWFWLIIMAVLIGLTSGISMVVVPFFYNKFYIKRLMKKGYKVASVEGSDIALLKKKLELALPEK